MKHRWAIGLPTFGLAAVLSLSHAYASSNLSAGGFDESDPAGQSGLGPPPVSWVWQWRGANQPVSFAQYDGAWNFGNLSQATPSNQWTTSAADNPFIPAASCERFHLNFWRGNFPDAANGFNPPPATIPQEVVVTDFEFQPFK